MRGPGARGPHKPVAPKRGWARAKRISPSCASDGDFSEHEEFRLHTLLGDLHRLVRIYACAAMKFESPLY